MEHKTKYNKIQDIKNNLKSFGHYAKRYDYSKVQGNFELPDLISIQKDTYKVFIEQGIQEIFNNIFPIMDNDNHIVLSLLDWSFKKERRTMREAKDESKNYEAPIYARLSLSINEDGRMVTINDPTLNKSELLELWIREQFRFKTKKPKIVKETYYFEELTNNYSDYSTIEITITEENHDFLTVNINLTREGDVFLGDFPIMTPRGTFIINGSEKIIVSQLIRSPGVYFKSEIDLKTGIDNFFGDITPSRGTWLEFEIDSKKNRFNSKNNEAKNLLQVKIEKSRKILVSTLLTALGLKMKDVLTLFAEDEYLKNTYDNDDFLARGQAVQEIYKKVKSGETASVDGASKFLAGILFDHKKYDLTKAGRYKLNNKLNAANNVLNLHLAQDIFGKDGTVVLAANTLIDHSNWEILTEALNNGACLQTITTETEDEITEHQVQLLKMVHPDAKHKILHFIGIPSEANETVLMIADILATISYLLNYSNGYGSSDDIDHLGNRRVRTVGELLQNQFRIGMGRIEKNVKEKISTTSTEKMKPINITNNKPLTAVIGEFFNLSQLSQFMDQTNPLAELSNKRRLTALGPGGLTRDRATLEVRDVHYSHYGRICPIETPEGPNIGLINNLSTYARVNQYGFIETPYRKVVKGVITNDIVYLTASDENKYKISQSNLTVDKNNHIASNNVVARFNGDNIMIKPEEVNFVDISSKQIVSIATACIPFLENDDASRALMGANMQRQAIPLLYSDSPIVGTGVEYVAARDSGLSLVAQAAGTVEIADSTKIVIRTKDSINTYKLSNFERSNQGTAITHLPLVKTGDVVEENQIIADGPSMKNGELSIGQNVLVAFMTWNGYNYEDGIIVSERLVKDDVYTSIHIEEYQIERRKTKQGVEEITKEIPNTSEQARKFLDKDGIVMVGTEVKEGDILVGKVTPKGQIQLSSEDKLLQAIFGEKSRNVKDNSLRVANGGDGIVQSIKRYSRAEGFDLPSDVEEIVKVYITQKRKIREGDKMAGRHGNKGVISKVLPIEEMPFLADGTPIDIMLNPLGVPSRMNLGQILEIHLGMAARNLGIKVATPVFDGATNADVLELMDLANIPNFVKSDLFDGRTGEKFNKPISVGVMYMLKLSHMVDDKLHARNVGPYSLITQQPLGGKAQNGGQRFGEMEVWALEAYGASRTLQEMLTVKSDDILGRTKTYEAIVRGKKIPECGIPESFNVLTRELQGLGINVHLIDETGNEQEVKTYDTSDYREKKEFINQDAHFEINDDEYFEEEEFSEEDEFIGTMDFNYEDEEEEDGDLDE